MTRIAFAAITLDERGGGVAAAARLMWRAIDERWPHRARLVTLGAEADAAGRIHASSGERLQFASSVAKAQALRQCDCVFYSHLSLARVQSYLAPPFRQPYGVFLHGIEVWKRLTVSQLRVTRQATVRIANSLFTANRAEAINPGLGLVASCPLAIPPATVDTSPSRARPAVRVGSNVVLLVGRMSAAERYKGHDQLLDTWPAVLDRVPDATLVFVGDGDDAPRLKAKARQLGISARVVWTGFASDAERETLFQTAAVFAMPSSGEGFGLAYIEAMAHGLPCIAASDDAAREVVEDGVTGYVVDQADAAALADRLIRLLRDESLRRRLGSAGRDLVQRRYLYRHFAERFVPLLEAAFDRPGVAKIAETVSAP